MIENRPADNPRDSYSNAFVGRCAEMCGTYCDDELRDPRGLREAFAEYMQFRLDNPEATTPRRSGPLARIRSRLDQPAQRRRLDTRDMGDREANTVDLNQ